MSPRGRGQWSSARSTVSGPYESATGHGPLALTAGHLRQPFDGAKVLAASRRTWALSVFSQVNSGSERPKWPPLAVLR